VKLVVREAESGALRADLHGRSGLATSRLGVVEAERAIRRTMAPPLAEMRAVFDTVDIVEVSPSLMAQAGALTPVQLRTLDAIHLATLLLLGAADLDVVTYDDRLVAAARDHGFTVVQPGRGADAPPGARNESSRGNGEE
jgi:predicted nucleic acid-binding protein